MQSSNEQREAYDFLQQCLAELENAESMGNKQRIAQCKKWVEQAQDEYDQLVEQAHSYESQ
jgi:hypothetical protein